MTTEARVAELRRLIDDANHRYHVLDAPTVDDGEYDGWVRELEINGVGYRAEVTSDTLTMALGYSHPVIFKLPKGVGAKVDKNRIVLTSADRDLLGQTAAKVRELRPPEPYKGKGVKYVEETIKKKVGKAGATGSGGGG